MVKVQQFQTGISLIELMITIALLAILATTGSAFTVQWAKQAELDKATMSFKSAIALAKSTALRNEYATQHDLPISQLCFDANTSELTVRKASSTGSASCNSPVIFSAFLKSSIEIQHSLTSSPFKCFALNNYGQVISEITSNCKTHVAVTISNGTLNENLSFN